MRPIPPEILGSRSLPRVRIDRLTPESPTKAPRPRTQGPDAARRWRPTARRRWCGLALGTGQSGVRRWSRCGRRCGTRAKEINKGVQGVNLNLLAERTSVPPCAGAAPAGRAPSSQEAPVHQALLGARVTGDSPTLAAADGVARPVTLSRGCRQIDWDRAGLDLAPVGLETI